MVNWHDPVVIARCARMAIFIQDLCGGWYLWEFCISLRFDWDHLRGKHPFRWPQIAYFGTRYLLGVAGLLGFRTSLAFTPINCQTWYHATYALAHTCVALGSLLLFLRVLAISGQNKVVVGALGLFYLVQIAALITATVRIKAAYFPDLLICGVMNSAVSRLNYFISFGFDLACLLTVFFYLFSMRGAGIWNLLMSQGVIYFVVVISAYTVPAVLLILNLNDFMNEMLQVPSVVVLGVCTTRMYRSLIDFYGRSSTAVFSETWTSTAVNVRRTAVKPQSGVLVVRTQDVKTDVEGGALAGSPIELARKRLDVDDAV